MKFIKAAKEFLFKNETRNLLRLGERGAEPLGTHYFLEEYFKQAPALNAVLDTTGASSSAALIAYTIANRDFEVLGTNMTTALATLDTTGGVTITTAGASADSGIILPHLDTKQTAWQTQWLSNKSPRFNSVMVTGASIALVRLWQGFKLTNTPVIATDDDQCFFLFDPAVHATNWLFIISRAGVDQTAIDTGVAVAASTQYRLEIDINDAMAPSAYINGRQVVGPQAALVTGKVFIPYMGVLANTAAAKAFTQRFLRCSKAA